MPFIQLLTILQKLMELYVPIGGMVALATFIILRVVGNIGFRLLAFFGNKAVSYLTGAFTQCKRLLVSNWHSYTIQQPFSCLPQFEC